MAPIRKGDGTVIAPQGFQEVRKGDGTVLWSSDAIPDSVVNQWPHDEGSGTTLTDNVGSVDGTINGATWESLGDAVGGFYLDYDGVDDFTNLGNDPVNFVYSGDFTFTTFVRVDDTTSITHDLFEHTDLDDGLELRVVDDNPRFVAFGTDSVTSSLSVAQAEWEFVSFRYDRSAEEITFGVSGSYETVSSTFPREPAANTTAYLGARETNNDNYLDGGMDETTFSDSYLTNTELTELRDRRTDV